MILHNFLGVAVYTCILYNPGNWKLDIFLVVLELHLIKTINTVASKWSTEICLAHEILLIFNNRKYQSSKD